jgi:hypothetical protein
VKKQDKCKKPTKEKIKYQLGGQISDDKAEEILHQMERFCELLLEQLNYGQKI